MSYRDWRTGQQVNPNHMGRPVGRRIPSPTMSEEASDVIGGIVDEMSGEQAGVQEQMGSRSMAEHIAADGGDLFGPTVMARVRELSPTPERQWAERIQHEESLREEVREHYRDTESERHAARVAAEVESMTPEQLENYYTEAEDVYAEIDASPNEWSAQNEADLNEAAYREEQAKLQAQAGDDGDDG